MPHAPFDPALVARAQAGDAGAREQLLAGIQPILRAFFLKRLGRRDEIDDLVQNTLLRIHNSLNDLNDQERLKAFSMKAAFFELQDLYRGRYTGKEYLYDPDHLPDEGEYDAPAGLQIDLDRALATLTPKARRIIELREYGYRYEEIAETIDSTEAAIKMQVKRAFEKMRDVLVAVVAAVLLIAG